MSIYVVQLVRKECKWHNLIYVQNGQFSRLVVRVKQLIQEWR